MSATAATPGTIAVRGRGQCRPYASRAGDVLVSMHASLAGVTDGLAVEGVQVGRGNRPQETPATALRVMYYTTFEFCS